LICKNCFAGVEIDNLKTFPRKMAQGLQDDTAYFNQLLHEQTELHFELRPQETEK
jgi:hypothetical protein